MSTQHRLHFPILAAIFLAGLWDFTFVTTSWDISHTITWEKSWSNSSYSHSVLALWSFLRIMHSSCIVDMSLGDKQPIVNHSLYFVQFRILGYSPYVANTSVFREEATSASHGKLHFDLLCKIIHETPTRSELIFEDTPYFRHRI